MKEGVKNECEKTMTKMGKEKEKKANWISEQITEIVKKRSQSQEDFKKYCRKKLNIFRELIEDT